MKPKQKRIDWIYVLYIHFVTMHKRVCERAF